MFRSAARLFAAASLAFSLNLAAAEAAKEIKLTPEQAASVKAISAYINSFRSLQGEFVQTGPKGNSVKGVFFLSKPGKMRFEYAPPNPFLIVSDGRWVTIKNQKKDKADQYPLSQTPLRLVLSEKIDLLKETEVLGIDTKDGVTTVALEDRKGAVPGHIVLVYNGETEALERWVVVDGQGRKTTVALQNVVAGVDADPKLFTVKINRKKPKHE